MLKISVEFLDQYSRFLADNNVPKPSHGHYQKWLRYYLDFCHKYGHIALDNDSLTGFIRKLHEKNQTIYQQKQASHTVQLYYQLMEQNSSDKKRLPDTSKLPSRKATNPDDVTDFHKSTRLESMAKSNSSRCVNTTVDQELLDLWDQVYWKLKEEINIRHYSPKTLRTYSHWIRQFQSFVHNKYPDSLENEYVKAFLTFLAVKRKVAASTQNQALNAVLFLFRHIIGQELGDLKGTVRAKKKERTMSIRLSVSCTILSLTIFILGCDKKTPQRREESEAQQPTSPKRVAKGDKSKVATKYQRIFEAAEAGDLDDIKKHLSRGVDIDLGDADGVTALHFAAWEGHKGVVEFLLAKGADANTKDSDGETALMGALEFEQVEIAKTLLDKGAKLNAQNDDGKTPLYIAAEWGHKAQTEMAEMLLAKGANPNVASNTGATPIQAALHRNDTDFVELLREHGATE